MKRGSKVRTEKGQAWSMDLVIGVLIFLLAVGVIYTVLVDFQSSKNADVFQFESEIIAKVIVDEPSLQVAPDNELDMDVLVDIANGDKGNYDTLKQGFGIENEFCIFLQDEEGNLVYIYDGTDKFAGIGSGDGEMNLTDENIPCGVPCQTGECGS
ncbi:MAG: hypothetical protein OXR66_02210 [Candidatus Woesearchaeota archaeon]|nr:hypothetical protein [Candidatus Woesearchaeota archaeon]